MIPKVHVTLIQASCIFLLTFGGSLGTIISSRGCLPAYDGGDHVYYKNYYSYHKAMDQCSGVRGTLPMPTQLSWSESLDYAVTTLRSNKDNEGVWIGVTVSNTESAGVTFTDADGMKLTDAEIEKMSLDKTNSFFTNLKNGKLCIKFSPLEIDRFRPEDCNGGRARTVCRCTTGLRKRTLATESTTTPPLPPKKAKQSSQASFDKESPKGNASDVKGKSIGGSSPNQGNGNQKETDKTEDNSPTSTVTTILGVILSVCLIATAYFIVKARGRKLRDRISRQMSHNRSQSNENDDSCREGRLHSEDSSGYHRPIHVYEEILGRNSTRVLSCSSPIISNGHAVSTTLPRLPPPEPPCTFVEIHEIRPDVEIHEIRPDVEQDIGYLRPSFYRHDGIPGDVRSPPPSSKPVFDFPSTPDARGSEGHLQAPQQELKYASVETVQTLLDGDVQNDEEYFVDSENADVEYSSPRNTSTPIFMKQPETYYQDRPKSPEFLHSNRSSVANPYVDVNDLDECSPPPSGWSGEYENERFLRTVMKVPPKKPRRTMKKRDGSMTASNHQQSTSDSVKELKASPTRQNLPLYSKVNKTAKECHNDDNDYGGYVESNDLPNPLTIGYTPMGNNDSSQIMRHTSEVEVATYADIPELPEDEWSDEEPHSHDYEQVPASRKRNLISQPMMLSTTNVALSESSLVCYEIPPEEFES